MKQQRGGTLLGFIFGLILGLGVALAVAVYVMKVPTPFNSKSTSRTPAQDAAENKKNKEKIISELKKEFDKFIKTLSSGLKELDTVVFSRESVGTCPIGDGGPD